MNNTLSIITAALLGLSSCKKDPTTPSYTQLSEQEKMDLIYLREEEKLAHDVYVYSFKKYKQLIFSNISSSEEQHMNSVLILLNKYDIPDPIQNHVEGIFKNITLQQMYNQFTSKADSSLIKALEVGATIEDLDINDIKHFYTNTSNADLIAVYNKLSCGSRNHLRSFIGQLEFNQTPYIPQFITKTDYNTIINTAHEKCGRNN
jgi:hypothetical protein